MFHIDSEVAGWFHARLTHGFATVLYALSEPGSGIWIAIVLVATLALLCCRRRWATIVKVLLSVPCGMLLGEAIKLLVQRHRPFATGWFVNWSGYSFPSGHTLGATLLYGMLVLLVMPRCTRRRWRWMLVSIAAMGVMLVAFSRVALGAHYVSDVTGGAVFGVLWLGVCFRLVEVVIRRTQAQVSAGVPVKALELQQTPEAV